MDCLVPVVEETDQLGESMKRRQLLAKEASRLITEAKTDVEALIEGTLDIDAILSGKVKPPTWETVTETINKEE
jgi:hypothetical protein